MAVKISVKNRFKGKSQEEQFGLVADVLRNSNIEYLDGDREEVEALCKLLETTGVRIDDKGKLNMSKASANMLCKVLSRGDVQVKPKDLKTLPDLVDRIEVLSKGLDISDATINRLRTDLTKSKSDLDSTKASLTNALTEKAEAEKSLKASKKKERNAKIVATILAVATAVSITFGAIAGVKSSKNKAALENAQATVGSLLEENEDLKDQLADYGVEFGQIKDLVGAQEGEDLSDKVAAAIQKDPELQQVVEALGGYYEGDVSDSVAKIVLGYSNAKKELSEVEAILVTNNQTIVNEDVSAAVLDLIADLGNGQVVTPDDGVTQSDVDAVYNVIIDALSGVGVTAEDLIGKDGKFSLDNLSSEIKLVVEDAIESKATINNIGNRLNGALGVIFAGDETKDSIDDYASIDAAFDAIDEALDNKVREIYSVFGSEVEIPADFFGALGGVKIAVEELQGDYNKALDDLEKVCDEIEKIKEENAGLKEENSGLKDTVEKLEGELDDKNDTNAGQDDTEKNENTEGKAPVSGEEPKDETNPNQNKPNPDKGGESDENEPDFN